MVSPTLIIVIIANIIITTTIIINVLPSHSNYSSYILPDLLQLRHCWHLAEHQLAAGVCMLLSSLQQLLCLRCADMCCSRQLAEVANMLDASTPL